VKITKSYLKQVIKEELGTMEEAPEYSLPYGDDEYSGTTRDPVEDSLHKVRAICYGIIEKPHVFAKDFNKVKEELSRVLEILKSTADKLATVKGDTQKKIRGY
jgi:hypothetical protein